MRATGLTHGPFYNHFASKEALMSECVAHAAKKSIEDIDSSGATAKGMRSYLDSYLSAAHRDFPEEGCIVAALSSDVAREPSVKATLTDHIKTMIDRLSRHVPGPTKRTSRKQALTALSTMIGALVLSRAVDNADLSEDVLASVRESIKSQLK